jgi:dephospho-CoA kinase
MDAAGNLRRDWLAKRVFSDPSARKQLEEILHPRIRQLWQEQAKDWRTRQYPVCVVAIPLLFETKAETEFDGVICIACSAGTQKTRLRARDWSDQQIQQRIGAQMPVDQKIARAARVIWTEGSMAVHAAQLDLILAAYAA